MWRPPPVPHPGRLLGLGNEGFGLFAGTAVNDTSSVTAAAAAWDGMHPGANTLDTATIVKLTRTLAIIPITLALALRRTARARRAGGAGEGSFSLRRVFPFFLLFFMLASLITTGASLAGVDAAAFAPFKELSKFFIIMAMAAIGTKYQPGHPRKNRNETDSSGPVLLDRNFPGQPVHAELSGHLVSGS